MPDDLLPLAPEAAHSIGNAAAELARPARRAPSRHDPEAIRRGFETGRYP
jgi:hypothetical protein